VVESNKIESKLKKVNELVEQKNYFEEKKKRQIIATTTHEIDGIQIDQKVFQKKYKYEKLKNVFSASLAKIKIGQGKRKIDENIRKIETLNKKIEMLGKETEDKNKLLLEKYQVLDQQNESIERITQEIDLVKINIENINYEIDAKDRSVKSNKKVEQELEKKITELKVRLEQGLIEAGAMKKSLDWQADFLREKQNEKENIEKEIDGLNIQAAGGVSKKEALKYETGRLEKQICDLIGVLNIKRKEVEDINKKCEQVSGFLKSVENTYEETKQELAGLNSKEEYLKQDIKNINEKVNYIKNQIQDFEDKRKEVQYKIIDKEKEAGQVKVEMASLDSKLTELRFVLDSKQKKYNIVSFHTEELKEKLKKLKEKIDLCEIDSKQLDAEKGLLESKNREYVAALTQLQSDLTQVEGNLEEKKAEVEDYNAEIGILETKIEGHSEKLNAVSFKYESAKAEYENVQIIKNNIIKKSLEIENDYESICQSVREVESKKHQILLDLEKEKANQLILKNEILEKESTLEKISQENEGLVTQLESSASAKESLNIKVNGLQSEIARLNQIKIEFDYKTAEISRECEAIKNEIANQTIILSQIHNDIEEKNISYKKIASEKFQLQEQYEFILAELEKHQRVLLTKGDEKRSVEEEIYKTTQKNQTSANDLKIIKDEIVEYQREIKILKDTELGIKQDLDESQKRVQILTEKKNCLIKEGQDFKNKNEELNQYVQTLNEEIVLLEKSIGAKQEEKSLIENNIRSLQLTIKDKGKYLSSIKQSHKKIDNELMRVDEIKSNFEDDYTQIKERIQQEESERHAKNIKLEGLKKDLSKIQSDVENAKLVEHKIKIEIDSLKTLVVDCQKEIDRNNEEMDTIQKSIFIQKDRTQGLEEEVGTKNSELRISTGLLKSKKYDLNLLNQREESFIAEINSLENKISQVLIEIEKNHNLVITKQREINIKNTKIEMLTEKMTVVSRECNQKLKDVEEMDADIMQLDNRIMALDAEYKIQNERKDFVEKQLFQTKSRLADGLNKLASLEDECQNQNMVADNAKNQFKIARKELRDISLQTISKQREISNQENIIDYYETRTQMQGKPNLPPIPKCLNNMGFAKANSDFEVIIDSLKESFPILKINNLSQNAKKYLIKEREKFVKVLSLIASLSRDMNKIVVGNNVNDILIQFDGDTFTDGLTKEYFEENLMKEIGDQKFNLKDWYINNQRLFGVVRIETERFKALYPEVNFQENV